MNDVFDLTGRTALVTGAGSGLGRQFALILAAAGAQVVVAARRREPIEETVRLIAEAGGRALPVAVDVTDAGSVEAALDAAQAEFGPVTVLVNNAGVSRVESLLDGSEDAFDLTTDTNLKGVWLVARAVAQRLAATGEGGSIINIASILASGTAKGLGAYMAAKSGVVQLTRGMALEWAELGIRVNAIAPGYFPSEMTGDYLETEAGREVISHVPLKRAGDPVEMTGPLLLLASDASSYMNGSVLTVDGGHLCQPL